ncbi:MAG TPA: ABC transporter permease [Jatrophihabitantaceae bacterium]|nr:ABC transporter permease [Jatrophihabitantaceae bacterium]
MQTAVPPSASGEQPGEFAGASESQGKRAFKIFVRSPIPMAAMIFFVLVVLTAFIAPYFYRWKFNRIDTRKDAHGHYIALSAHPGQLGHPLGTDGTGFDLLARMFRGTQRDVIIVLISTTIALAIGITMGALAGYFSSFVDNLLMRFVDVMLCVPVLVILIIVASNYPSLGAIGLGLLLGLFGWMGLSRLVRAQFLALKEREFVEAAHAMGASNFRIIFRHLIPNAMSTILVFGTLFAAVSIVAETSLTYLGYGVHPPDTSLGLLISQGVGAAETRPWLFYYPGILILLLVLAVNLIGEGIRNAFDPRHNRVRD